MAGATEAGVRMTPELRREVELIVDERIRTVHVTKEDFSELKGIVGRLGGAVERLAEAQARTEQRVEELAQAQARTERRVEELAQAQARTERRVEELAQAQREGFQSLRDQIAALGSRWGIYNEGTFRATIRGLLSRTQGVEVRQGVYGDRQVDLIIRDGEHVILEITSRMHAGDIERLYRSADDYRAKEGVEPALMVATSYISPRLMEKIMGLERKIEIFSYEGEA
ncbi:MAG: DUF3782 domain-containing protein [Candidatus Latescibacterota bacterium]